MKRKDKLVFKRASQEEWYHTEVIFGLLFSFFQKEKKGNENIIVPVVESEKEVSFE